MNAETPTLRELQRAICGNVLGDGGDNASKYVVADGLDPQARLAIYRNTATGALVTALRLSYPAVRSLVGEEFFEGAARIFIEQNPPRSACLDFYGAKFPEYLSQMPEAASLAYLPDTARLEWAVNEVLHAAETAPLDLARIGQLEQDGLEALRFAPSPAIRVIQSPFPVDAIWRAVLERDDSALMQIDLASDPVHLLVRRSASGVEVNRMLEQQWRFMAALLGGRSLHEALVEAQDAEASAWLAFLLASGCFTDISLPSQVCDSTMGGLFK